MDIVICKSNKMTSVNTFPPVKSLIHRHVTWRNTIIIQSWVICYESEWGIGLSVRLLNWPCFIILFLGSARIFQVQKSLFFSFTVLCYSISFHPLPETLHFRSCLFKACFFSRSSVLWLVSWFMSESFSHIWKDDPAFPKSINSQLFAQVP